MVVFRLFEKLRCSSERSTKFESLRIEVFGGGKWEKSLYGLGRQPKIL